MLLCHEVSGVVDWAKTRDTLDASLDEIAASLAPLDPETWGTLPHQVADQDRILRRGGDVG